jgi:hypothetical protein
LEQEGFLDPPGGEKRILDVVAKVPTHVPVPDPAGRKADHSVVVIDVEIESPERSTDIRARMLWYYEFLRRRHSLPVFPVCLFLKVGLDGIGWDCYEERLWDHTLLRFEYPYIGLPALDGMTYLRGENLLALAFSALMKLPPAERVRIKVEGLAKIVRSRENNARKGLLAECFNNYLELNAVQQIEFDRVQTEQPPEVKVMVNSFEKQGRIKQAREMVQKQLEKKCGALPPAAIDRLKMLPIERLEEIALSYTDVASLQELGLVDAPPATAGT